MELAKELLFPLTFPLLLSIQLDAAEPEMRVTKIVVKPLQIINKPFAFVSKRLGVHVLPSDHAINITE